jgi:uncharacterized protein (DUF697 family)/predicted GTPase
MAIDKTKTKELIEQINVLFNSVASGLPEAARNWLRDQLLGAALGEIEELVEQARPPVLYLIGRSGHGKSSLINALSGRGAATVGDVRPTTLESETYTISFPDSFATWRVVDSRGIFETTAPDGGPAADVVDLLKRDIAEKKPDLVLHVIASRELRNLSNDLAAYEQIKRKLEKAVGAVPPAIVVLTQVDTLGNPRDWPPESSPKKLGLIDDCLRYLVEEILTVKDPIPIDRNAPFKGFALPSGSRIAAVPVCALKDELWNIETLQQFIGEQLPKSAILDFYQATKNKALLRRLSRSITQRFAMIAGGIGSSPIPISDIIVLTPLQLLLTAIIGGLSCRSLSVETAKEFFAAAGIAVGAGWTVRLLAQQIVKLIPIGGAVLSGAIAAAGTYGMGKSAEVYFFNGELLPPKGFTDEWPTRVGGPQVPA